jgi:Flp pilus assembly protein TadB
LAQGSRAKKLEQRREREKKEEAERQEIDLEEAKFQAAQRKAAIDKVKTQQYYQTDRVKSFHVSCSGMLIVVSLLLLLIVSELTFLALALSSCLL